MGINLGRARCSELEDWSHHLPAAVTAATTCRVLFAQTTCETQTNCDAHVLIPHSVLQVCFTVPSLLMPLDTGTNEAGQLPSPTSIGTELAVRASRLRRNLSCSFRNLRAFLSRINLQRR